MGLRLVDKAASHREPPRPEKIPVSHPMANTKSAAKRARQTAVRSLRNRRVLTRLRKMHKSVAANSGEKDQKNIRELVSAVDKAAKRGIIHRNAAIA